MSENKRITDISFGVIVFSGNDVLLVNRPLVKGHDLPKGHLNSGESTIEGALREIVEETGYKSVKLLSENILVRIQYEFIKNDVPTLKEVIFYIGELTDLKEIPEANHDDSEMEKGMVAEWIEVDKALELITFPPMRKALEEAMMIRKYL